MKGSRMRYLVFGLVLVAACTVSFVAGLTAQQSALVGRAYESGGGTVIKVLFDGPRQEAEVDVAEITFPPRHELG